MTRGVAKDKQRNFGKCSVSLVKNREIPCLLFAGFWKNSSPQRANFEKCCSLLLTLQDCESCEIHLSTDCDWDSSLVVFLLRLKNKMKDSEIKLDFTSLPLNYPISSLFLSGTNPLISNRIKIQELTLLKFILLPLSLFCRLRTI